MTWPELDLLNPTFPAEPAAFFRAVYGFLLLAQLVLLLPHARRYFLSERWGGYGQSCRVTDLVQNPVIVPVLLVAWLSSAMCLAVDCATVAAALINLVLCRYFFLHTRWKSVLRGMGAPGLMTWWVGSAVVGLELTGRFARELRPLAVWTLQVDFALILFTAGLYKWHAGYRHNEGMEYGLVNPQWGSWWQVYRQLPPGHRFFRVGNQLAWAGEAVAAVLLVIPAARWAGAALLLGSFLFVGCTIRLQVLPALVALTGIIYFIPATLDGVGRHPLPEPVLPGWLIELLATGLWCYLALLPLAYAGLYYNFYARKTLPASWQAALEWYTNLFGINLWRVFSADHTHFFIRIYRQARADGSRVLISHWGTAADWRYGHVGEAIAVTTLFTTLKYYPTNRQLFTDRLLRYARTVPCPEDSVLLFEYVHIRKALDRFDFTPAAEFIVDVPSGTVEERRVDDLVPIRTPLTCSPVHEALRPGTYAPART